MFQHALARAVALVHDHVVSRVAVVLVHVHAPAVHGHAIATK